MIDIKFLRENPDAVRENIRKKFQDAKLPLVDEAVRLDAEKRAAQQECEQLKAARNKLSKANSAAVEEFRKRFGDEMTAKLLVAEERFRRNQIHKLNRGKGGPDVQRPQKPRN